MSEAPGAFDGICLSTCTQPDVGTCMIAAYGPLHSSLRERQFCFRTARGMPFPRVTLRRAG